MVVYLAALGRHPSWRGCRTAVSVRAPLPPGAGAALPLSLAHAVELVLQPVLAVPLPVPLPGGVQRFGYASQAVSIVPGTTAAGYTLVARCVRQGETAVDKAAAVAAEAHVQVPPRPEDIPALARYQRRFLERCGRLPRRPTPAYLAQHSQRRERIHPIIQHVI